jgi:hypothetical protein
LSFVAVAIGGSAALGAGVSSSQGKKSRNSAQQLQQNQLNFAKQQYDTGMTAWQPAKDYWSALLQGGPAATTAVGPYAAQLRLQSTGASRAIQAGSPAGGERNLALANNNAGTYSQIQRLTAGVQPMAASALGSLAGLPISASSSTSGQATALTPSILNYQSGINAANQQGAQGMGTLLYNAINKNKKSPGGTGGTPPFDGGKG